MTNKPLAGSDREALPGAHATRKADPNERLEVTILLRRRANDEFAKRVADAAHGDVTRRLDKNAFGTQFGADSADIAAVRTFAGRHGLVVTSEDPARRTVILSGTVAQFDEAFGTQLQIFEHDNGSYRGRTGPIQLPDELHGVVEAVLGLDNRPQAKSHLRVSRNNGNVVSHAASAAAMSYTPVEVATLYGFPPDASHGQCIGIIELGGGYRRADVNKYFQRLGIPAPAVSSVSIDHVKSSPTGDPNGPDGEVMLDIEVAGAIAPGARIVVYFAPNTDAGFLNAITTAIHDSKHNPSVISISWGAPESAWTQQAMTAFDQAFQTAATLGITVCVASGDGGSTDGADDGQNHVDFPASSPFALGCGGTALYANNAKISGEVVWNDGAKGGASGGGVSSFFAVPPYQATLSATQGSSRVALKNRGVPDVSGDADPETGYEVRVDGSSIVIGGTSAVAPLWAGLLARINGANSASAGFINPKLYSMPSALRDVTRGDNGAFSASAGWDACTGLGSPDGAVVAGVLGTSKTQATVQTVKGSGVADATPIVTHEHVSG